jgi:hypothetical protein
VHYEEAVSKAKLGIGTFLEKLARRGESFPQDKARPAIMLTITVRRTVFK